MPCLHPDFTTGDVEIVPGDGGRRFRANSTILRYTSRLLASRKERVPLEGDMVNLGGGVPTVIQLDEDETTIEVLLRVTHGADFYSILNVDADMDMVERVALAAEKYAMPTVLGLIRLVLHCSPLRTSSTALQRYRLATRFGWERTAVEAAWDSLDVEITFQKPLSIDARHLERLLAFRRNRCEAFAKALNDANGMFAAENAGTCPRYCEAHGTGDSSWTILKLSMLLQMGRLPSGSSLFCDTGAVKGFQKAICAGCAGPRAIHDWGDLRERIQAVLDDLANTPP